VHQDCAISRAITGDWSSPLAGALTGLKGAEMAGFAALDAGNRDE
jgi:hypothetical protein